MRRYFAMLLILALLLTLFAGCAAEDTPYVPTGDALAAEDADLDAVVEETDTEPQEFSLAYYADRALNPFTCGDYTNRTLFSLIYQGLFSASRDYTAVPILCESYEMSDDYKTYTFYIYSGAAFSDGSALTISDVLASYQAAQKSSYYGGRFTHVSDIALENGGITFYLSTPVEDFPLLLDIPIVKASQVDDESPLGSGAYILESTLTGAHLRRNPSWWCESSADLVVTAASIPLVAAEDPISIRDGFEFSDIGLVCADPCADNYADFRCDYELWECENGIFLYLACNVAYSQNDIFEDAAVRSLLTYAIDRETLVEENYRGFARATTIAISPNSPDYSPGLAAKYEYDPVKFINSLGKIPSTKEPLRLLVNSDDSARLRTARSIAEMLTECGLETVTVELGTRQYKNEIVNGAYDLYLGATRLSVNMDLSPFFRPYTELSRNGVSDPTIYELCKDALENRGNFYTLHKAVADDSRIIPIMFCSYAVYADRGLLTDLAPARDNVFYYTLGRTDTDALIPADYAEAVG